MTKNELIMKFKEEYPTINKTINGEDIAVEEEEYEALIAQWADNVLAQEAEEKAKAAEEVTKVAKKAELLEKLGITEDEAKLLLS